MTRSRVPSVPFRQVVNAMREPQYFPHAWRHSQWITLWIIKLREVVGDLLQTNNILGLDQEDLKIPMKPHLIHAHARSEVKCRGGMSMLSRYLIFLCICWFSLSSWERLSEILWNSSTENNSWLFFNPPSNWFYNLSLETRLVNFYRILIFILALV